MTIKENSTEQPSGKVAEQSESTILLSEFYSIEEIFESFPTEESCIKHLESLHWGWHFGPFWVVTPSSPFYTSGDVYHCKDGRYRCKSTKKYFTVKTNTLFHGTKISLNKWFAAIWLATGNEKISSVQLAKEINITQKSAWLMLSKIDKCFGGQVMTNTITPTDFAKEHGLTIPEIEVKS